MQESLSSKDKIKNELLNQLANDSYDKVTITKIANALSMSRRNIYKHYSSKEEILSDIVQEKLELFFNVFESFYLDNSPDKWVIVNEQMLSILIDHKFLIREIVKDDSNGIVFKQLKSAIARALGHVARINKIAIKDRGYFDVYTQFLASSSYHITKQWMLTEEEIDPKKVGTLYSHLFNDNIVEQLRMCAAC